LVLLLQRSLEYHYFKAHYGLEQNAPIMLDKLFGTKTDGPEASKRRMKALAGSGSADLAANLLTAPTALMQLSPEEAKVVVSYMKPRIIAENTVFIKEGDVRDTGYMMLVLDGEVTVENIVVSRTSAVTVNVLGPGSLIGEMGLVDGAPRSATCTATSEVRAAVLSRESLEELMNDEPRIGGKLMMAVALRIAERLRETADKLRLYSQLTQAMQQEIDRLMPT
jgi:CRP/FNR family transcriptional regulator, cyclic AMP receptor protein